jgi:hypothetical protein
MLRKGLFYKVLLVPVERIELPTFGLQNRCITAEAQPANKTIATARPGTHRQDTLASRACSAQHVIIAALTLGRHTDCRRHLSWQSGGGRRWRDAPKGISRLLRGEHSLAFAVRVAVLG